jgi:MFS family permease
VTTLVALAVGSLLAAVAPSIGVMIVARVIQGVAGGMIPVAFGIIRDEFPSDKVAGAVGSLASLTAVGAGLGIVLAGPIVNALDYHWLFWLPMILTVAAAVSAVLFVPESPVRTPGRISWVPALLLALASPRPTSWRWSGPCAAWYTTPGKSRAGRGSLTSTWPACAPPPASPSPKLPR